jgi:hypothetical protein
MSANSALVHKEIPEELVFVEEMLYDLAEITDEEARDLCKNLHDAFMEFNRQMGFKEEI